MNDEAILTGLTEILRDVFFDNESLVVTSATTAEDVPGWDSMTHINIVVEVERVFGIRFRTAEIEELRNVGDMVRLIGTKLAARG